MFDFVLKMLDFAARQRGKLYETCRLSVTLQTTKQAISVEITSIFILVYYSCHSIIFV